MGNQPNILFVYSLHCKPSIALDKITYPSYLNSVLSGFRRSIRLWS